MKICENCKRRPTRNLGGTLCRACQMYKSRYGKPRPYRLYVKRPSIFKAVKPVRICGNCHKETDGLIRGRCDTCSVYFTKNGVDRPESLYNRSRKKVNPNWCKVCTAHKRPGSDMCKLCTDYLDKNGFNRPKHLWDSDPCCSNCSRPLKTRRNGSRCSACRSYYGKYKIERPVYLWGAGLYGWCDCGSPANHTIDDYNFCDECRKDYKNNDR